MKGAAGKKVTAFAGMIGELSGMRATAEAYELGLEIAVRSGIIGTYKMQQTPEAVSALENIEELINSVRAYTDEQKRIAAESGDDAQARVTLDEWLQNVALLTDMDNEKPEERNKVTMMTVHGAKGLEFEYVYVAGLEENLFPSMMSLGNEEGLEEERRLFFVALTRAKRGAVLSFAESRFKWGEMTFCRPSRFLGEIDPKFLDIQFDADDLSAPEGGNDAPVRTAYGGRGGYRKQEAGRQGLYGERPDVLFRPGAVPRGTFVRTSCAGRVSTCGGSCPGDVAGRARQPFPQRGQPPAGRTGAADSVRSPSGGKCRRGRRVRGRNVGAARQIRNGTRDAGRGVVGRRENYGRVRRSGTENAAPAVREVDPVAAGVTGRVRPVPAVGRYGMGKADESRPKGFCVLYFYLD